MHSMEICKNRAHQAIHQAMISFKLQQYQTELEDKVNDLCLAIGYDCQHDHQKFRQLAQLLWKNIASISKDENVRDKLCSYVDFVIALGKDHLRSEKEN